ncbi:hypothetical protein SAMN05421766_11149 [Zobellia uliginosa]|uniref:DUF4369 domain-containing protein n=1 Tax=Zobellia uliginosa TaxID=143224 RepID=A0ABY1L1P9_9FLAO|nr:hypothetical protein [Zobellia uliginosa]SIT11983.1 hypothetical protein SAMN05421766_11149 [Zobellia uliginosa]
MKIKNTITLIFTFILIGFIYGQDNTWNEGELFLKNGESKKGLIKVGYHNKALTLSANDQTVFFKSDKRAKKEKFKQEHVDYFINSGNEYYTYIPVSKNKRQLFKRIIEGKASLYVRRYYSGRSEHTNNLNGMKTTSFNHDIEYYILKKGESKANLYLADKVLSVRKKALKYFSDCPSLIKELKAKKYGRKYFREIVEEYNKCDTSE